MKFNLILSCFVAILALVNPIQKVLIVTSLQDEHIKIADLTTVPIAIPMIAGPATITAAVTFPVQYSRFVTIVAILLALAVNLFFMLKARRIGSFLIKYNFMNPLIRIIGLIVATIGLQMVFDGITLFIKTLA